MDRHELVDLCYAVGHRLIVKVDGMGKNKITTFVLANNKTANKLTFKTEQEVEDYCVKLFNSWRQS